MKAVAEIYDRHKWRKLPSTCGRLQSVRAPGGTLNSYLFIKGTTLVLAARERQM